MSYIQPNTFIVIMKQVPLEQNHSHTIKFNNASDQYDEFYNRYHKFYLGENTYQRVGLNKIRVEKTADNLYDCNYLIFGNSNYGTKKFYAFITKVKYINDNVSEIEYEIDVFQTWLFDFELEDCFIEREHSESDELYENIVGEDIKATANIILQKNENYYYSTKTKYMVYYVPQTDITTGSGEVRIVTSVSDHIITEADQEPNMLGFYRVNFTIGKAENTALYSNGEYVGCTYFSISLDNEGEHYNQYYPKVMANKCAMKLSSVVRAITLSGGRVVAIKSIPDSSSFGFDFDNKFISDDNEIEITPIQNFHRTTPTGIETYTPKNKKLLTYPFKKILVSNNQGNTKEYRPELFFNDNGKIVFRTKFQYLPEFNGIIYPRLYNNIRNDYENSLNVNLQSESTWSEDSYALYFAQEKNGDTAKFQSNVISGALAYVAGETATYATNNPIFGIYGDIKALDKIQSSYTDYKVKEINAKNLRDQYIGSIVSNGLLKAQNRMGFTIYEIGIDIETAKQIDNYFSCYGYSVNKVKKPNLFHSSHLREHWNYLKTNGCHIKSKNSGINFEDIDKIENIFNNGVTVWNSFSRIGDYGNFENNPT